MREASKLFSLEMDLSEIPKMSYDEAFETILEVPESVLKLQTAYCFMDSTLRRHSLPMFGLNE